jgi:selenide,water dikinase
MARASGVTLEIDSASVPFIPGAPELAAAGMLTSGDKSNRRYVGEDVALSGSVRPELAALLFDPQTAGGLLISVARERADSLLSALRERYTDAAVIGRVVERGPHLITVE